MHQNSFWSVLLGLAIVIIYLIPLTQVLKRTGYSRAWVLIMFVPLINIIAMWFFAFMPWPALTKRPADPQPPRLDTEPTFGGGATP